MARSSFDHLRGRLRLAGLTLVGLGLLPCSLLAQQPVTVTGKVTSESGEPLSSAGVTIDQLGAGAATRPDGSYTILIPGARVPTAPVTVTVRLVGYKPRSAQVDLTRGSAVQNFSLADNPLQLGELVVTGAGTVSEVEKLGTGRSSVDSLSIVRSAEPNVINALAAKAPNVTITSSSGDPGASSSILIRGQTTISAGSGVSGADAQPLIIVDGVPIDNSISYNNPSSGAINSSAAPSNRAVGHQPQRHRERRSPEGRCLGRDLRLARGTGRHSHHHQERPSRPNQVLLPQLGIVRSGGQASRAADQIRAGEWRHVASVSDGWHAQLLRSFPGGGELGPVARSQRADLRSRRRDVPDGTHPG